MNYSKIDLMQIEKSDVPVLKNFINAFRHHLVDEQQEVNTELVNDRYNKILADLNSYHFAIRGFPEAGFGSTTLGFVALRNIDWISRLGEVWFLMQDEEPTNSATIPNTEASGIAFTKLCKFAFEEINLHKVWIPVVDGNNILNILDRSGWVAEGIRREARLKRGGFVDIKVYSILAQEWREML
jgi:RimJ/RimL family protein N-acetyltransferase